MKFEILNVQYRDMLIEAAKEIFIEEINNLADEDSITEICNIWDYKNRFRRGGRLGIYGDLHSVLKEIQKEFNKTIVENTIKHKDVEYVEDIIKSL